MLIEYASFNELTNLEFGINVHKHKCNLCSWEVDVTLVLEYKMNSFSYDEIQQCCEKKVPKMDAKR